MNVDAYFQLLSTGAGHPTYDAPEWQQSSASTMDLSESMLLDDIDVDVDVVDDFFSQDPGHWGTSASSALPFPSNTPGYPTTIHLDDIDIDVDVDIDVVGGFVQDPGGYSHTVSSRVPFPLNMAYTPGYVPAPTRIPTPTISNVARFSHTCCELSSLPTIPISKTARLAVMWREQLAHFQQPTPSSSYSTTTSNFPASYPPSPSHHPLVGGLEYQQQVVPSDHCPVLQQPGPSQPPRPFPRGKGNKIESSHRTRDVGQKHHTVEDAAVQRHRRIRTVPPLQLPPKGKVIKRKGRTLADSVAKAKAKEERHGAVVLKVRPPEAQLQQEFHLNEAGIPMPRYHHEVPPNQDHEGNNMIRGFVEYG